MRITTRVFTAGLLSLGSLILPSVSLATDARTAIRLCDRNPSCTYRVHNTGDVSITVGDDVIECPQDGECQCVNCTHERGGPTFSRNSVQGVLTKQSPAPTMSR